MVTGRQDEPLLHLHFFMHFFENGIRAITEVDDETQLPCLGKMFFFCGCVYLFVAKPSFIRKGTS